MSTIINCKKALDSALNYAGLTPEDINELSVKSWKNHLEICFVTDFLEYDIFVESETDRVVGFDCRPTDMSHEMLIEKLSA